MKKPQTQFDQLKIFYPTLELYEIAIQSHGTQMALSKELKISTSTLLEYKKWLQGDGVRVRNHKDLRNGELDQRIMEMFGSGYANVKVYKIREGYVTGQVMNPRDLVREEISRTALSCWGRNEL